MAPSVQSRSASACSCTGARQRLDEYGRSSRRHGRSAAVVEVLACQRSAQPATSARRRLRVRCAVRMGACRGSAFAAHGRSLRSDDGDRKAASTAKLRRRTRVHEHAILRWRKQPHQPFAAQNSDRSRRGGLALANSLVPSEYPIQNRKREFRLRFCDVQERI